MAKKSTVLYKLLSSAGTGFFYVGEKNTKFKYIIQTCSKKNDFEKI